MAKTQEELNALKKDCEVLNAKLAELSDEELEQVTGGNWWPDYYGEDGYIRGIRCILRAINEGNNADKTKSNVVEEKDQENAFIPAYPKLP